MSLPVTARRSGLSVREVLRAGLLVAAAVPAGVTLGFVDVLGRAPTTAVLAAAAACAVLAGSRLLATALALVGGGVLLTGWPLSTVVLAASLAVVAAGVVARADDVAPALHSPRPRPLLTGLVLGALSAAALVGWFALMAPAYPRINTPVLGNIMLPVLVAASVLALGNSLAEELFWRVIVLGALRRQMGAVPAIAVQTLAFGAMHWRGYPSGVVGVLLTVTFGVLAGFLVEQSRSVWPAVAAHVVVDIAVLLHLLAV